MRVVNLDSWRKARAIAKDGTWGSPKNRFLDWAVGEKIVVLVAREGVMTGDISGPRSKSDLLTWGTDTSDWCVPISGVTVIEGEAGQHLNDGIRDVLKRCYGEQVYFRLLLHGVKLGDEPEIRIRELLRASENERQD